MLPVWIFNRALATKTEGEWGYHPPPSAYFLEPQGGAHPNSFYSINALQVKVYYFYKLILSTYLDENTFLKSLLWVFRNAQKRKLT
jgi:hypothetical protein